MTAMSPERRTVHFRISTGFGEAIFTHYHDAAAFAGHLFNTTGVVAGIEPVEVTLPPVPLVPVGDGLDPEPLLPSPLESSADAAGEWEADARFAEAEAARSSFHPLFGDPAGWTTETANEAAADLNFWTR